MCRCNYCNLKLLGVQVSFKSAACDCSNSALVLNFIRLMEVSRQLLEVRIFFMNNIPKLGCIKQESI